MNSQIKDLVVLAADNKIEVAMKGILSRHHALEVRSLSVDYYSHPEHDPGCFRAPKWKPIWNSDYTRRDGATAQQQSLLLLNWKTGFGVILPMSILSPDGRGVRHR